MRLPDPLSAAPVAVLALLALTLPAAPAQAVGPLPGLPLAGPPADEIRVVSADLRAVLGAPGRQDRPGLARAVAALAALDADVLLVAQASGGPLAPGGAVGSLVEALDAEDGPGTWAAAGTGSRSGPGPGAVRSALLYRPAAVAPLRPVPAPAPAGVLADHVPVAQAFRAVGGGRFTLVADHGTPGTCRAAAAPDGDAGRLGCADARRQARGRVLTSWIGTTLVPAAGDPDVLVLGDLGPDATAESPLAPISGYADLTAAGPSGSGASRGRVAPRAGGDGPGPHERALASASLASQVTAAGRAAPRAGDPAVADPAASRSTTADRIVPDPVVVDLALDVAPVDTTTTVSPSGGVPGVAGGGPTVGAPLRWTARVVPAQGLAGTPTGSVQFFAGGSPLGGPVPLVGGVADSPVARLPAGVTTVRARFTGRDEYRSSEDSHAQAVRYGLPAPAVPVPGARVRAGSDVTVLARLTDADGEPIPDAAAAGVLARCGVTVAAAGAQVRRPVCARYDGKRHAFALAWPTTAADAGEVTLTVAVTSPGIPAPQTRDVPVVLVP